MAHDKKKIEKRGNLLITRGLPIKSAALGMSGICDVVEFHKSAEGIALSSYEGLWQPYPVEYKKGAPKEHEADQIQLCAQAICLEEMLLCQIPSGSLFYGEIRRREKVDFSQELRDRVYDMAREMHELWDKGYTPKVKTKKGCNACSLKDICIPRLGKTRTVRTYMEKSLLGE